MYHSLRYSFRYGDRLQVGVTGEKDAGEPFFALHDRQGYDYYSFYLLLKGWGRLETLAVGNYRVSFGQGLVLGNGFGLGKTFSLATAEYRTEGFRKHSSSDTVRPTNTIIFGEWELPSVWLPAGGHRPSIRTATWTAW